MSCESRSELVGEIISTFFDPNDIPGQKRRLKCCPSLRSASTLTSMPGAQEGTEAYHSLPSDVGNPLWVNIRSCIDMPMEKPKCIRFRSAYGLFSILSLGLLHTGTAQQIMASITAIMIYRVRGCGFFIRAVFLSFILNECCFLLLLLLNLQDESRKRESNRRL